MSVRAQPRSILAPVGDFVRRLAKEPPFRVFVKAILKTLPVPIRTKLFWDAVARPHYLYGVLTAADEAKSEGVAEISVIEFGVGQGHGLLLLQKYAEAVAKETGIAIRVWGFDSGQGHPADCGDYRDHPDAWKPGDYAMDEAWLRAHLKSATTLVIGPIAETLPRFMREQQSVPIGFVVVDVDLYSSTREVLKVFSSPQRCMLRQVGIYCDSVNMPWSHRYAGELLAIREFNEDNVAVKIDRWRGIECERPFPVSFWLKKMFLAHDLEAITRVAEARRAAQSEVQVASSVPQF